MKFKWIDWFLGEFPIWIKRVYPSFMSEKWMKDQIQHRRMEEYELRRNEEK